jgi:hypothetical protein
MMTNLIVSDANLEILIGSHLNPNTIRTKQLRAALEELKAFRSMASGVTREPSELKTNKEPS